MHSMIFFIIIIEWVMVTDVNEKISMYITNIMLIYCKINKKQLHLKCYPTNNKIVHTFIIFDFSTYKNMIFRTQI